MKTTHLSIIPIPVLKDNYVWTLIDTEKNTAIIVDPGDAVPVADYLQRQELVLSAILITHHHWDHTNGVQELKQIYRVPVFGPGENIAGVTHEMREGDEVSIEGFPLSLRIMSIPAHTLGHIAYYNNEMVFCGDTLFAAGCGRVFEGTPPQMYASLQKLAALPDTTKMYCGHEYTANNLRFAAAVEPNNKQIDERIETVNKLLAKQEPSLPATMAEEKATNPFLRCSVPEVIQSAEKFAGRKLDDPAAVFAALRAWKDGF